MTTWVETTGDGRGRGPVGIARAWAAVLRRPRRFFTTGVAPGEQAPGLAFAVVVAVVYVAGLLAVQPGLILGTSVVPILGGSTALTMLLVLLVTAVVAAPAGLHLTAAIQTVLLMLTVDDRAGVSETVQVVADVDPGAGGGGGLYAVWGRAVARWACNRSRNVAPAGDYSGRDPGCPRFRGWLPWVLAVGVTRGIADSRVSTTVKGRPPSSGTNGYLYHLWHARRRRPRLCESSRRCPFRVPWQQRRSTRSKPFL